MELNNLLAFYHYPFVPNSDIREYSKDELMKKEIVEELFDYAQILEAYITRKGWSFLVEYYGYEKLYEIDKKSGWFDEESIEAFIERIQYDMETWTGGN